MRRRSSPLLATEQAFRDAMASICTPVSVVTGLAGDRPHGTTVNSFGSLSLVPPMILLALDRESDLLAIVRAADRFGVNLLGQGQDGLAQAFARKGPDKFAGVAWREDHGLPRIDAARGWLACEVEELVPGGDHVIVLGLVTVSEPLRGAPLVYHNRCYGTHSGFVGEDGRPTFARGERKRP